MIGVWLWPLILENVLKMISVKGSAIFPLGVANAIAFADRQPVVFANRAARFGIGSSKPRNHQRRFRLELLVRDVVVREGAIERILPRGELSRNIVLTRLLVRIVYCAIVLHPI